MSLTGRSLLNVSDEETTESTTSPVDGPEGEPEKCMTPAIEQFPPPMIPQVHRVIDKSCNTSVRGRGVCPS